MKKTLKGILCLVLVLGMIPAAVISAFAQGKGVGKNDSPNHTIENAKNQYIPERIDVDGVLDDLGWVDFKTVDSVSGVWNVATVTDAQKSFSYKYCIRRDHENLYVAVDFGGETVYGFNVYFSADDGATVTTVSFDAQTEKATVADKEVDKIAVTDGTVELMYRLTAKNEYVEADTAYKYFIGANYSGAALFYPAVYPESDSSYLIPTNESVWSNALVVDESAIENGIDLITGYVNIDADFNEGYWSHLTKYHMGLDDKLNIDDYKNGEYELIDFSNVYYSTERNDGDTSNQRLKTEIRMDKNAIYGDAIIYNNNGTVSFKQYAVLHVKVADSNYRLVTYFVNDETEFKFYKDGAEVTSTMPLTGAKVTRHLIGNTYVAEFRIDLQEFGAVFGSNDGAYAYATVYAYNKSGEQINYASIDKLTTNANENKLFDPVDYKYKFRYGDIKGDDVSDDITLDGKAEPSLFKSLLAYDRYVYGMNRVSSSGTSATPYTKQFAFELHSDYEYLYGAALVDMNTELWQEKTADNDYDYTLFSFWINSEYPNSYSGYTHAVKFYIGTDGTVQWSGVGPVSNLTSIEAAIKKVDGAKTNVYAIEFKIPVSSMGLNIDATTVMDEAEAGSTAIAYAVSVDDDTSGTRGLAGPRDSSGGDFYFRPAQQNYWAQLYYNNLSPAVVANGVMSEHVWRENGNSTGELDLTKVDCTNATLNTGTDKSLSYSFKLIPGYENLYCAAEIDSADIENKQFSLWLKTDDGTGASHRFTIRCKKNETTDEYEAILSGFCYRLSGDSRNITIERGYENVIRRTFVKYSMHKVGEKLYLEFILNYEHLGTEYTGNGFKYFVAVEDYYYDEELEGSGCKNEMIYPALSTDSYKGNADSYASVANEWTPVLSEKAENIEPLKHIVPETIKIDGNLNDSGWNPEAWITVSADGNAVIQGGNEGTYAENGNEPFDFKYQLRHDDEYLYVAAIFYMPLPYGTNNSSGNTPGDTQPEFRIWITPKDDIEANKAAGKPQSFMYLYDISATESERAIVLPDFKGLENLLPEQLQNGPTFTSGSGSITVPDSIDSNGYVTTHKLTADGKLNYNGMTLRAAKNMATWYPNGGNAHVVTNNTLVYDMTYGDTVFYGYNELVQENLNYGTDNGDDWYAKVDNESYSIGNEHAYIGSGEGKSICNTDGSETNLDEYNAVIEFKIKKSEFDPNNTGFEYCFTATIHGWYQPTESVGSKAYITENGVSRLRNLNYALHYPARYNEVGSEYSYWGLNLPYWRWVNALDFADIEEEAKLRNDTTPVVSLGAKVSNGYTKPDGTVSQHAIRFGARYEEKYIRYLAGMGNGNYWDVKDMGICVAPKVIVDSKSGGELTLETPEVKAIPADNIVDWKSGGDGTVYGTTTNFADYENFVFYVTVWDVPESMLNLDFSFRGYTTFYTGTYDAGDIVIGTREEMSAETFYGNTIVRNFNEVQYVSESLLTEEELPDHDGDFGVEDFEGRS